MNTIRPLGDQAALASCSDERAAFYLAAAVRRFAPAWLIDVVQAYQSIAVHFDLAQVRFEEVSAALHNLAPLGETTNDADLGRRFVLPCCYSMQLDLERIGQSTGLTPDQIVHLHAAAEYIVYAVGFSPGFPYLGYLPEALCGVPRLEKPRIRVEAGSVGLAGRQTGVYPEARPGGWNLIGRTPLQLVDVRDGYFPLRTGDRVRFEAVNENEFRRLLGKRL
jgi:inhibitor of KinA